MDPYSIYAKQQEYYEYVQKQIENPTDLTNLDQSSMVRLMAERVFSTTDTTTNLYGILGDDSMIVSDIFCMLVEFVLNGLDILTQSELNLFGIENSTDDIIFKIKRYLKSMGFDMKFHEETVAESDLNLFRGRSDWFYEIVPKANLGMWCPPSDWYVLNYRLIPNRLFNIANSTNLTDFKAFVISHNRKIFTLQFMFHKNS